MKHVVVGTAGHIDHGKTSLVRALTGVDTDRLAEEKRRGISIDLGFAHLDISPALRIAFVDVPGHEKFIKNMLAGAAGVDSVMFIIAADESIMPQTREHFDICRLLGVTSGVIALTKVDMVDPELLELVRLEVEEFVAGSFLEGAPIVPVSSVTGQGLDELRKALAEVSEHAAARNSTRFARLPIDRSFVMRGFGTVVTGTLKSGQIQIEQEMEVHPAARRVRVRGIQVHGAAARQAVAGQRTAINISGAEHSELTRGMVLAPVGAVRDTQRIDCRFELLPSAKPLKHRAPVHFHAGTSEVEAEARLLDGSTAMLPGTSGFVRFLLKDPVLLLPGDRFVVRMFSPVVTIGGGEVIDAAPPLRMKRAEWIPRLQILAGGSPQDKLALLVREAKYGGGIADLVARTGWTEAEVLAARGALLILGEPPNWFVDPVFATSQQARLRRVVAEYHKQNPLQPGMPKEELRSRELAGAPPFLLDALLKNERTLVIEGDVVRLNSHKVTFKQDEEEALARMERNFESAGLTVPGVAEVLAGSGVDPVRAKTLLQILLKQNRLQKVSDELVFHPRALEELRNTLSSHKGERFAVPTFKEWTGVSRKYAIPLLEFLDRVHVTRREGDLRVVL